MRRGLILIAALAVAGLGCSDDDSGDGGSGGRTLAHTAPVDTATASG